MKRENNNDSKREKRYSLFSNYCYAYGIVWKYRRYLLLMDLGKVIFSVAAALVGVLIPAAVIGALEQGADMDMFVKTMMVIFGLAVIVYSINGFFEGTRFRYIDLRCSTTVMMLYESSIHADYQWLEREDVQQKLSRAENAINGNENGFEGFWIYNADLAVNVAGLIVYICMAASIQPVVILLLMAVSALQLIVYAGARSYEEKHKKEKGSLWMQLKYFERVTDKVEAGKDVRLFHLAPWLTDSYKVRMKQIRRLLTKERSAYFAYDLTGVILSFLRDFVCYGYLLNRLMNGMSVSQFVFYLGIVSGFAVWFSKISENLALVGGCHLDISDYRRWTDGVQTVDKGKKDLKDCGQMSVVFEDVSFSYPGSDKPVLDHISFKIEPGKKMALVGTNGAGKTTIVKLLCGLYHPDSGRILVNGTDLSALSLECYQKAISAIFQKPLVLETSVIENVSCLPAHEADRERCETALKLAGLYDKVRALPDGIMTAYGTATDENGIYFSGGEFQKLVLARALYKNASLILLDEPTAAMDAVAEKDTYELYSSVFKDVSTLFISHRLASTRFCDEILFLEKGRIVQRGTHDQLMQQVGGYAKMFEVQSRYYQQGGEAV